MKGKCVNGCACGSVGVSRSPDMCAIYGCVSVGCSGVERVSGFERMCMITVIIVVCNTNDYSKAIACILDVLPCYLCM